MPKKNKPNMLKNLVLVSQIGISMVVTIGGSVILGGFLDRKLGTNVLFLIIFVILGVGSAFLTLFRMITRDVNRK